MQWTVYATGNVLAAAWLALAALSAMLRRPRRREKAVRDGTGLVLWGAYLVALLALNLHTSPFGTLPRLVEYAGIAAAGAAALARLFVLTTVHASANGRVRQVAPVCNAIFCAGLTAASGNLIALVTVMVASSAATAVALSDARRRDWDTGSR